MRALNGIWVTWKFGGKDGLRYCVIKDAYGLKEVQEKKKKTLRQLHVSEISAAKEGKAPLSWRFGPMRASGKQHLSLPW